MTLMLGDIVLTIVMGAWLAGSGFLGHVLADGNDKIASRLTAISIVIWCIVASGLFLI